MLLQILAIALLLFFVVIAVLAFIEPGPLDRRSRNRTQRQTKAEPDQHDGSAR